MIAKQLESNDRTDLNQIMKHKITQTLDLALLLSGEPDQSESQNNTEAKQVCWMIRTKSEFQKLIPST